MILESWYWKKPLLEMAGRLREFKATADLNEEQLAQVERDIFIGFYSVRKLIETITKVTDATKSMQVQVGWYPNQKYVNWRNNHKLDELYDLNTSSKETRDIVFVCGRIIHSFIFTPVMDKYGLAAILFTSDTDKQRKLYSLEVDDVIRIFEHVGNDDPTKIHWQRNPTTGEEITIVK